MLTSQNKIFNMPEKSLLDDLSKSDIRSFSSTQPSTNISKNYLIYNNTRVSHQNSSKSDKTTSWREPQTEGSHNSGHGIDNKICFPQRRWFSSVTTFANHSDDAIGILLDFESRLLWLLTFGACLTVAAYMINEVWKQYYENPVIVTFNPSEESIDAVPFPAVTICNMNPFSKLKVQEFEKRYKNAVTPEERNETLDALRVIYGLCSAQQSFVKSRGFAKRRGFIMIPEASASPSSSMDKQFNDFLLDNSQPCGELLRFCEWESQEFDCEKLFRPILTDYGMCCSFNALPQQRMLKEKRGIHEATRLRETPFWNDSEVVEWRKWRYHQNLIIKDEQKYPFRQQRAGMLNGLSLLVDPDIDNSFCPSSDSEGIKVLLHAPIEAARVADLGSIIGLNREAFLQVTPDVTISDPGIADYDHNKRNCYFGKEYKLKFYKPYTKANCQEECWNEILLKHCKCVMYYTPRDISTDVCSSNPKSHDFQCVQRLEAKIYQRMDKECRHCIYSCNNLAYTTEVTSATLQSGDILWTDDNSTSADNTSKTEWMPWMQHRLSIVHIYMGHETIVPKLRRKLYNTIDLIANSGGVLGLLLGFSFLSAFETCYIIIVRLCHNFMRHGSTYYSNTYNRHSSSNGDTKQSRSAKLSSDSNRRLLLNTANSTKVHDMLKSNNENSTKFLGCSKFCKCFDA